MRNTILLLALLGACNLASADGLQLQRQEGFQSYYSGTLTVSGQFQFFAEDEFNHGLCFYPQGSSAAKIPRSGDDERMPWFCFSNQQQAFALLQVPSSLPAGFCSAEGSAQLRISQYMTDTTPSEVSDIAHLESVLQSKPTRLQPCETP